jgi:hypothetical protein
LKIRVTDVDATVEIPEVEENSGSEDNEENKVDDKDAEEEQTKMLKGSINPNEDDISDLEEKKDRTTGLAGSIIEIAEGVMVGKGHILC